MLCAAGLHGVCKKPRLLYHLHLGLPTSSGGLSQELIAVLICHKIQRGNPRSLLSVNCLSKASGQEELLVLSC